MILWFIGGFIVWALCILFMLAIFNGGNIARRKKQRPYLYTCEKPEMLETIPKAIFRFSYYKISRLLR